jgi:hypothetical protein
MAELCYVPVSNAALRAMGEDVCRTASGYCRRAESIRQGSRRRRAWPGSRTTGRLTSSVASQLHVNGRLLLPPVPRRARARQEHQ